MAGTCDSDLAVGGIIYCINGSHEAFPVHIAEIPVDEIDYLVGLSVHLRAGAEQGTGHGHHHGRGCAMSFGVGHQESVRVVRQLDDIVVIASGITAGLIVHRQLHCTDFGQPAGQKPTLQSRDDLEFVLQLVSLALNLAVQAVNGEVGIDPDVHLFRLKRFRDIINRPFGKPLHLVGRIIQGGKKNNRDVPCSWIGF